MERGSVAYLAPPHPAAQHPSQSLPSHCMPHPQPHPPTSPQAGPPRWSLCPPSAATSLAAPPPPASSLRPSAWRTCSTAAARCTRCMRSAWRRLATPAPASWVGGAARGAACVVCVWSAACFGGLWFVEAQACCLRGLPWRSSPASLFRCPFPDGAAPNATSICAEEFPPAEGAPPPEKLLVFLTVRGRGRLLAYSSHKPLVGAGGAQSVLCGVGRPCGGQGFLWRRGSCWADAPPYVPQRGSAALLAGSAV